MTTLKCKLTKDAITFAGKNMWGLDCDAEVLKAELYKVNSYIWILEDLQSGTSSTTACEEQIPECLKQEINSYAIALNRKRNKNCRNCN